MTPSGPAMLTKSFSWLRLDSWPPHRRARSGEYGELQVRQGRDHLSRQAACQRALLHTAISVGQACAWEQSAERQRAGETGRGPCPQLCGGVGLHDLAQVRLQGLEDELRLSAGLSRAAPLCLQATKENPCLSFSTDKHSVCRNSCRRTPCLPRQKTKLRGSPFLAGSAKLGTCVRVLRCIATGRG